MIFLTYILLKYIRTEIVDCLLSVPLSVLCPWISMVLVQFNVGKDDSRVWWAVKKLTFKLNRNDQKIKVVYLIAENWDHRNSHTKAYKHISDFRRSFFSTMRFSAKSILTEEIKHLTFALANDVSSYDDYFGNRGNYYSSVVVSFNCLVNASDRYVCNKT